MGFKDTELTFSNDKITAGEDYCDMEVMMSWDAPIMEKTAEYICQSKGNILEIGFGMGICSDYIQAQGVNSHTIVEVHPQIIERLNIWASGKSNVTIVEGDWNTASLSTYDGIFLDTFGDESEISRFKSFVLSSINTGAKVTYWNNVEEENNRYSFDNISFERISVSPASNSYTNISSNYYMPRVEF